MRHKGNKGSMNSIKKKPGALLLLALLLFVSCAGEGMAAGPVILRIKDIARLEGVRDNQLTGTGLVVGLNGTGDSSRSPVSAEMVANILARSGIIVEPDELKVKNVAVVTVSAVLPPFKRNGDRIDIHVSSIGDAKSLQGGYLLQTPLFGADGRVYAVAQKAMVIGGYAASGSSSGSKTKNHPTQAFIPGGAIVEETVPMQITAGETLRWSLNNPDFTTASRLARTINDNIGPGLARAVDMGLVEVAVPAAYRNREVEFIAELEGLPVTPDGVAKVIVNEKNGTIVIGENVRIAPVAVSHGNITVRVGTTTLVSQPPSFSAGETVVTEKEELEVEEEKGPLVALPAGASIGEIVRALNAVGTKPQDIIAILIAINQAGALYGVLEVL